MSLRSSVSDVLTRPVMLLAAAFASGCASPQPQQTREPVFYPAPPAPARVQFMTSYSTGGDIAVHRGRWYDYIIGKPETPELELVKPYGVCLHENRIFACDTVGRSIAIFDLDERKMNQWIPAGEGRLHAPINLAFDAEGSVYVADADRGRVMIFDRLRNYAGALAHLDGMKPTDVAVAGDRVYVADLMHHNVAVYDRKTRRRLFTIPAAPVDEKARLFSPTNLALDPAGRIYVSDSGAFRVQKYDAAGRHLMTFGMHGDGPGQFARPKGLAVDREGRLFVVDAAMQVVQVFAPDGGLLMYFGEPAGRGAHALSLPADVTIDYDHVGHFRQFAAPGFSIEFLVLVTSQYGDGKVNVYGFGRQT